jgi:hypothetical protein
MGNAALLEVLPLAVAHLTKEPEKCGLQGNESLANREMSITDTLKHNLPMVTNARGALRQI